MVANAADGFSRILKWYRRRLSVMRSAEFVRRIGEFMTLKKMQWQHFVAPGLTADASFNSKQ